MIQEQTLTKPAAALLTEFSFTPLLTFKQNKCERLTQRPLSTQNLSPLGVLTPMHPKRQTGS